MFSSIRRNLYYILESAHKGGVWRVVVNSLIVFLIILNVFAVILESDRDIYLQFYSLFYQFEVLSVSLFALEYLARIWVIPEKNKTQSAWKMRLKWLITPSAVIDLLAILPSILHYFIPFDLRLLRIFRLIRILKLARYFTAMQLMLKVIAREKRSFQAVLMILLILIIISASAIYVVEHNVQPQVFGSIPKSMWWAVVTLTTVGYGDVTPITPLGKILGAIITVLGIGVAALPAGILASGFASELNQRRQRMEQKFRQALMDENTLSLDERKIRRLRRSLGLSRDVAHEILQQVITEKRIQKGESEAQHAAELGYCPHCGKKLPHR
ncbi:ion transporter [Pasteurellaceae bacterium 20609_3]|uniref:ion transporter n=1 Tax=Spirabiliibacterium mucosae TaxID=28156 RepID=UPI001AAD327F|nr:ion transporter [Spirabiliibacterium mucosae]MBE2897289.1 ion transporter [Spirabiliibacterium mucosae]